MSDTLRVVAISAITAITAAVCFSLGSAAYSFSTYRQIKAGYDDKLAKFEEDMRAADLRNAYRMGSFWEIACEHPNFKPHMKDDSQCIEHRRKTGKKD